jgi:S-adenosylmethionine decarboxylase
VATCGVISPLRALNYLVESFESDIVVMDYRVRGFTRDIKGKKHYIDHKINSIQDYLSKTIKQKYEMLDVNVYQENLFHTKMHLKEFDLDTYLFEEKAKNLSFKERSRIELQLAARDRGTLPRPQPDRLRKGAGRPLFISGTRRPSSAPKRAP